MNQPSRGYEPPVRSSRKMRKSLAWIWVLMVVSLGSAGYWLYVHFATNNSTAAARNAPAGTRSIPVVIAMARLGQMEIYLDGLGTVTSLNTVTIHTRVDGQIDKVAFKEGQLVKKGDLLVQLDPRPFQVQLTQAQGQLAKDQAAYDVARKNVDRDREAKDAIAAQQLDTDTATMEQAQGSIKVDEGQIASAQLQLTYCRVTSPISGRIGLRLVDEGNIVHAGDTNGLAVITQVQPISVVFNLSETDIRDVLKKIHSGPPLAVEAFDSDRTRKLATGSLVATDSQIDSSSGTLRFKAVFANNDDSLFPNQFVNARLRVDTLNNVILVPKEAIQLSPDSTYVYVVKNGESVEMRKVTAGATEGDDTVVTTGLAAGEVVVVDGVDKLQDQSKVTPRTSSTQPTSQPSGHNGGKKRDSAARSASGHQAQ